MELTLTKLQKHSLFVKKEKFDLGANEISYFSHTVSKQGVQMEKAKIAAVLTWPQPSSMKSLLGFLGLHDHYRKFMQNFGSTIEPLTALFKKELFQWTDHATKAFSGLNSALASTPPLASPDFHQPFGCWCSFDAK